MIADIIKQLQQLEVTGNRKYTVVIPSGNIKNLRKSITAIKLHQPDVPIIIVADGEVKNEWNNVQIIEGKKPFCFAVNANIGINACKTDVILLNDDAILQTPNGFDILSRASKTYGIVSARLNGRCSNNNQKLTIIENHTEPSRLAFVCPYITREVINKVGLLDERYLIGTFEDDDYCKRVTLAGYSLGVCGSCIVDHNSNDATFEKLQIYNQIFANNKNIFEAKYNPLKVVLSICICSIYTRGNYLARLMTNLLPQVQGQPVELLQFIDNGQASIGEKRQRLLAASRGTYHVSIDDDDLVAPDYIRKVLLAAYSKDTDCITYKSKRYCDGVYEADCIYSINNTSNSDFVNIEGIKTYIRYPYHVTPIKRDIALKVGFTTLNHGEDTKFAEKIKPLLQTENHIDEFMYYYWYRSERKGEITNRIIGQ